MDFLFHFLSTLVALFHAVMLSELFLILGDGKQ